MIRALFLFITLLLPLDILGANRDSPWHHLLGKGASTIEHIEVSSGPLDDTHDRYHVARVLSKDGVVFLYVIRETPDGLTKIQHKVDVGSAGQRPQWKSEIRKKSVFVSGHTSGGCCSHSGFTFQFKLNHARQLAMIGYEDIRIGLGEDARDYEDHLSLNLITGDAITTRMTSSKRALLPADAHITPPWRTVKLLPPITTKTRRLHIPSNRQWTIQNLTLGDIAFMSWLLSTLPDSEK